MKRPLSLTARLALLFAAMTATLLIVVGVVLGRAVEAHFIELDNHELHGKFALIENHLLTSAAPEARDTLGQRLDDAFVGHDMVGVLLRDAEGSVIYAVHPGLFSAPQLAGQRLPAGVASWEKDGRHYVGRERTFALPGAGEASRVTALVGLDITHHARFLDATRRGLWLGISVAAAVAAMLGWWAAHHGLAPLRRVTATAGALSAARLGERLDDADAPAEVHELVEALNGMLDRLESAFQRLSDFSADIAHELRTPVSNLMTQTAVCLSRPCNADEYRDVLASNLEEYERIARMVGDMLFIAKAENGRLPHPDETVELAAEARALVEFYEALAEERGVTLDVRGDARVRGDALMLRRAISNLLSNAIRHTQAGGMIEITIADEGPQVALRVRNHGDTIPSDQLSRVFERFHRASADRQRHGEGAGLGLAITRTIVEAHGGTMSAESIDGVTTFGMFLPREPVPR
ncbi:Two component sensor regulator [Aromatoleum aromaticum EbN1]|uniref:Sensor protein n=1 Tax=Aromatoleum aromaticum (strain DSM 19018 / LMG 30748 / EbN1) TaxID=76114 RepID=Q5P614_AROAE|nr:heavy metal sensor histidine kinase [Aromatoleum aromaticum]CAI07247.1 Two component sensor regulator [Aromatoleum aromaticum EbN1]